ncbi:conjugal transfer protein [Pseudalkalibacillus sp. A8]|uniref:conjugal transfer protein n=1 Tax=Pseudalkalibacillus sp. A8 TaxID=3382641 RepID=UPI0038B50C5D
MKPKLCRNYRSIWMFEKKLYSIQDKKLPFPVTYNQLIIAGVTLVGIFILSRFPFLSSINDKWMFWYLLVPFVSAWFFSRFKADGKPPLKYAWSRFRHLYLEPDLLNRYNSFTVCKKPMKYKAKMKYRRFKDENTVSSKLLGK